MKILHVIPSLDPAAGGPPMVATRLAAAQASLGHDVALFAYTEPLAQSRIDHSIKALPHSDRLRVIHARSGGKIEKLFSLNARPLLAQAAAEFDLFHFHGVWETVLLAAASAARRADKPYVIAPHGMLNPWALSHRTLKKKIALTLTHKRMLNGAAFLHTLNADERDPLAPLNLRCPTHVLSNGVFPEEIDPLPPRGRLRAKHPQLGDDPFIVTLTRLAPRKGLDLLVAALALILKEVPSARLVIVGPDSGERANLEAQSRSLGVHDRVHLVGPLYGPDKYEAMVDATAFSLPSEHEGFSMAITEALGAGLPVVISPGCHFPDVAPAGAGFIVGRDPPAIAAALIKLLRDPALARQMGAAGRDLVLSRYTWPRVAQASIAAYAQYAPNLGRPAPVLQPAR